jgi:hypothetical protein
MIKKLMEEREVVAMVDLHGHSRKVWLRVGPHRCRRARWLLMLMRIHHRVCSRQMNMFVYGCDNKEPDKRLRERVFPRLLWENGTTFSFEDCNFSVQKSKESTARVVVWREMGLLNRWACNASV